MSSSAASIDRLPDETLVSILKPLLLGKYLVYDKQTDCWHLIPDFIAAEMACEALANAASGNTSQSASQPAAHTLSQLSSLNEAEVLFKEPVMLRTVTIHPIRQRGPSKQYPTIQYKEGRCFRPKLDVQILRVNRRFCNVGSEILFGKNHFLLQNYWPENHYQFPFRLALGGAHRLIRNLSIEMPDFSRNPDPLCIITRHFLEFIPKNFPVLDRLRFQREMNTGRHSTRGVGIPWVRQRAYLVLLVAFITLRHERLRSATFFHQNMKHQWMRESCIADISAPEVLRRKPDLPLLDCRRIRKIGFDGLYTKSLEVLEDLTMDGDATTSESTREDREFLKPEDLIDRYKWRSQEELETMFWPLKKVFKEKKEKKRLHPERAANDWRKSQKRRRWA